MGSMSNIPWPSVNAFLLECGEVHEPYNFCSSVLKNFSQLVPFDEAVFLMLDGNRRIVRKRFMNISRHWSSVYLEYYSRLSNAEYGLDKDISEDRSVPFVELINWEDFYERGDSFITDYIKGRGLKASLAFTLFDLNGAPATAFSLDRTGNKGFTKDEMEITGIVVAHLNNLYKNMFVRPPGQVRIWDGRGDEELTPREREVAELLCQGVTPTNIARELRISLGTANKHIGHIYKKYGVGSRQELLVRMLGK